MPDSTSEGWDRLARHPDGRVRLLFDDVVARYPDRYGEPDMPDKPRPDKATQPGATPDEVKAAAAAAAPPAPPAVDPTPPPAAPANPTPPLDAFVEGQDSTDPPVPPQPAMPMPSMPSQIDVDTGPPQYGDGEPFQVMPGKSGYGVLDSVGRLVDRPTPEAAAVDLATVGVVDPALESFVILQSDVWEEVVPQGTQTPSYVLKFAKGSRVPATALAALRARVESVA